MFLNKIICFNQRFFNEDAIKYKPLIKYNVGWSVTTKTHVNIYRATSRFIDLILNLLKWVKDRQKQNNNVGSVVFFPR